MDLLAQVYSHLMTKSSWNVMNRRTIVTGRPTDFYVHVFTSTVRPWSNDLTMSVVTVCIVYFLDKNQLISLHCYFRFGRSSLFIFICSEHTINEAQQRANDKSWTGQQRGKPHLLLPLNRKKHKNGIIYYINSDRTLFRSPDSLCSSSVPRRKSRPPVTRIYPSTRQRRRQFGTLSRS